MVKELRVKTRSALKKN